MNADSARLHVSIPELPPDALRFSVNSALCTMKYEVVAQRARKPCMTFFGGIQLGAVDVFYYEGIGVRWGNRGHHHIRADHIDDFIIPILLQAQLEVQQAGMSVQVGPGSFIYVPTSKPYYSSISATNDRDIFSAYVVRIPGAILRQYMPRIDHCCDQVIKIRPGASKIMVDLIELALMEGPALSKAEALRFGTIIIEAVTNATLEAPELLASHLPSHQTAHERILRQAKNYIECNLSNSELDSNQIAEHCSVSVRYLHAAFAAFSTTVGSFIRERRLQLCQAALLNPALCDKSITDISLMWGFNDSAYFSRAYKTYFGKAPSLDRIISKDC